MKSMLASIAVTLGLLIGCANSPADWTRSDVPRSQVDADQAQCQYEAKAATASCRSAPSAGNRDRMDGMGTAVGDGIAIAEKQIDLVNACMKAKGYAPR